MPLYNKGVFLRQTLVSVHEQSYPNWDCTIFDDGSEDESVEIAKEWTKRDPRFRLFSRRHRGLIPTLQEGFPLLEGDLVGRVDADDLYPKRRLESMVGAIQGEAIVVGKVKCFSDDGIGEGYKRYENWVNEVIEKEEFLENIFFECPIPSSAWLMKKKVFNQLKYLKTMEYPEDYDFAFQLLKDNVPIAVCREIVLEWRDSPQRISRNYPEYADNGFWKLKAIYFKKWILPQLKKKRLKVWGAGKKAKACIRALATVDVQPVSIMTNNEKKMGSNIHGIPVMDLNDISKDSFILICVSGPRDKQAIQLELNKKRLKVLEDYIWMQ